MVDNTVGHQDYSYNGGAVEQRVETLLLFV